MRQMNIKREDKNFFKTNQLQIGLLEEANEYQERRQTFLKMTSISFKGTGHFFETLPVGCVPDGTDHS